MTESACAWRIDADEFRPAKDHEVRSMRPCAYCFDTRVRVGRADLLVNDGSHGNKHAIHRHASTGELDYDQEGHHGPKLGHILRRDDVTSVADAKAALEDDDAEVSA